MEHQRLQDAAFDLGVSCGEAKRCRRCRRAGACTKEAQPPPSFVMFPPRPRCRCCRTRGGCAPSRCRPPKVRHGGLCCTRGGAARRQNGLVHRLAWPSALLPCPPPLLPAWPPPLPACSHAARGRQGHCEEEQHPQGALPAGLQLPAGPRRRRAPGARQGGGTDGRAGGGGAGMQDVVYFVLPVPGVRHSPTLAGIPTPASSRQLVRTASTLPPTPPPPKRGRARWLRWTARTR